MYHIQTTSLLVPMKLTDKRTFIPGCIAFILYEILVVNTPKQRKKYFPIIFESNDFVYPTTTLV